MRRGHWAGIAAGLAVVAAAAVTAGCGGGGGSALSLDPVAAAATKTQQAGAARLRLALSLSGPQLQGGKALRLTGAGAIDGTSGELTIDTSSLVGSTGIAAPAGTSVHEVSLREDGDYVVYVELAALAAHLPDGKHWVKLDISKLGKSAGVDLGKLLSGSQFQPSDVLSMLEAEGATITNLGSATVDGTAATHYRVTIDVAKALQAKGLTSPLLAGVAAQLPTVPADVWIGRDGLVHRIRISLGLARSHVGLTIDLYDYGTHVSITAPPSSDVYDATQLAEQGIAGGLH
ncbi:MAG TPA: LppX_LprAFG lipoprotein [Gaiellaceae bacterium]